MPNCIAVSATILIVLSGWMVVAVLGVTVAPVLFGRAVAIRGKGR